MLRKIFTLLALVSTSAWAAFPSVVNESTSFNNTDANNQVVTLPSSLVNGNTVVCALSVDGQITHTWPGSWEILDANRSGVSLTVGAKIVDGSEGSTVTVAASATEKSTHHCWQISGADTSQLPEALSANGNGGTPNPPDLTPTGGAKDYLWLAVAGLQPGSNTASGFPSSYGNTGQEAGDASTTQSPLAWGRRELNAASENPGTFTATSNNWMAATIAVHPASAPPPDPPEFDVAPTLDDCDSDSCTYDFTPDSSADLYWATYAPGATAPTDCSAVQTASGTLDDGSAAVTGADSVEIPYTLASQSTYFCLSNGNGDSDVESDLARLRDPRSGFAFVAFAAATNICDLDADFDPDCAVGDIFEYETAANENASCGIEILTDGDVVLTPTSAGDCDGRITFEASFERTQSGDTDGVFTAPTAGKFAGDETLALNDPDVACTVDDASPIVWDQDEEISDLDLNDFCSHPLGDALTYTSTGDSLPTGLTKTDNLIEGTPTVEDETGIELEYQACNAFNTCATLTLPVAYVVDTWTVPNLVGRTASEAASDICDAAPWRCDDVGLFISSLTCDAGPAGLVLTQDPAASAEAEPFEDIETTLSRTCAGSGACVRPKPRPSPLPQPLPTPLPECDTDGR